MATPPGNFENALNLTIPLLVKVINENLVEHVFNVLFSKKDHFQTHVHIGNVFLIFMRRIGF